MFVDFVRQIANKSILDQRKEDHDERDEQIDVDGLHVRHLGNVVTGRIGQCGHCEHGGHSQCHSSMQIIVIQPEGYPRDDHNE